MLKLRSDADIMNVQNRADRANTKSEQIDFIFIIIRGPW